MKLIGEYAGFFEVRAHPETVLDLSCLCQQQKPVVASQGTAHAACASPLAKGSVGQTKHGFNAPRCPAGRAWRHRRSRAMLGESTSTALTTAICVVCTLTWLRAGLSANSGTRQLRVGHGALSQILKTVV